MKRESTQVPDAKNGPVTLLIEGKPMGAISLQEAQDRLPELLHQLRPGEEITITDDGQPLAQVKKAARTSWPCQAGSYRKAEFWMAPDFDGPLDDFREYME
jgi:antitoxin (DNA-binding transcriptional repressor) of toxin-antitoxin stability system